MLIKNFFIISLFSSIISADDSSIDQGKTLYQQNCMACHHLDKMVVGPSLAEIAHIYKTNPDGIVSWSMKPGKKRKLTINMPPMSHVGEKGLKSISDYIFSVTKGIKYKKQSQSDPYATFPKPKILRGFMPNAGPAAIAISLNKHLHLCWDAGTCQVRYVWKGDYLDTWAMVRGNGNGQIKLLGDVFVNLSKGNPFSKTEKLQFKGYSLVNHSPVFEYTLNGQLIKVSFTSNNDNELKVTYQCQFNSGFIYKPNITQGTWLSHQGKIKNNQLHLTAEQGKHFTITFKAEK